MSIIERIWHSFEAWAWGWGGLLGLVGICLLLIWFFTPSWLSNPPAKALLLNVGLGCLAATLLIGYGVKDGYKSCTDMITAADHAAVERKNEKLRELGRCGVENWDITTGTCQGAKQ